LFEHGHSAVSATPGWLGALLQRLAESAPDRVLLVAPAGHPLRAALQGRLPGAQIDAAPDPGHLPPHRYALAVVAATLEPLEPAAARAMLAALRDRVAAQVVLWVDATRAPIDETELRALGFRIHARDGAHLLCGFDLQDYKERPDWLNPSQWAHPELWDKFRW
jgi:hypothetical protein